VRRYLFPSIVLAGVVAIVTADVARARPYESFTLEQHDRIIAEAPGCYANCTVTGNRRICAVKEFDCKVVCSTIPECKPDGLRPIQVCAVVKERQ
jgi:hypothetical protein